MRLTLLCLTTLCLVAPVTAQKRTATDTVLERLSGAPAEAQAAFEALVRGDRGSVRVLKRVIRRTKDEKVRTLAKKALALCEIPNAATSGLKVGLSVDRPLARFGDTLKFTVTLGNVTSKQIVVDSGMSYSGNTFENGAALALSAGDNPQWQKARLAPVGFCGTGAFAISTVIEPWQTCSFTFDGTLRTSPDAKGFLAADSKVGPHLDLGLYHVPFELTKKGKLQMRTRLQHAFAVAKDLAGFPRLPKVAPNYRGAVVSNEVLVTLDTRER